jgi:hypothetical protein
MNSRRVPDTLNAETERYTYLLACISEDDEGYLLQIMLYDSLRHNAAGGERVAGTFEQATEWIGALAAKFSIAANCIEIELRMDNPTDGTRH